MAEHKANKSLDEFLRSFREIKFLKTYLTAYKEHLIAKFNSILNVYKQR